MGAVPTDVDMNRIVGTYDIVLVTLDTLRYDAAERAFSSGRTPVFARHLGPSGWELRHAPATFTYASHHAFFAGFLPTPAKPGPHERRFALRFEGSETTGPGTCVLDGADIVTGLAMRGYYTACVGGVGFFNKQNPLGRALPGLFDESHWSAELGVTDRNSTSNQVAVARDILTRTEGRRVFLFLNVAAIHTPNHHYLDGAEADSLESHEASLAYVDAALAGLWAALEARGPAFVIACSDHGTTYGEDGFFGHRLAHPHVWNVPYGEFILGAR